MLKRARMWMPTELPHLPQLTIVFASTSGHTQYVVNALIQSLTPLSTRWRIASTRAEKAQAGDLRNADLLVLASGTWNTGGSEGQLNPYMSMLLQDEASNLDLAGQPCACIGLGDDRYSFTARAVDLLEDYVKTHRGRLIVASLKVVNEPYGQDQQIRNWAKQLDEAATQIESS
jgi:flavodoxin I